MRNSVARLRGAGYILWHGKHMVFHILLGLMWAWFLRERWNEFNFKWIFASVAGSLLPDIDHFLYFFTYGKSDPYTRTVVTFFKSRQWRVLTTFMARGHKYNTNLTFHNYYTVVFCIGIAMFASFFDWRTGVVLFGAMASHFLFDIGEDIAILGRVNPNWKRWGSGYACVHTDMATPFTTRQVKGHGRGKLLGFPTVNMEIPTSLHLVDGIYAVWITIGEKKFMGALHYGPVPVFGQEAKSLEVFLLDVKDEDIGNTSFIQVTPVSYLREVRAFSNTNDLVIQIKQDVAQARKVLQEAARWEQVV